ncbi:amidohydrolase family protein [Candidatus Protochlamydia phocaeensis]|uniref:amidohydrolase family protein n=1 Tax=Candidatus Protochlamydia phocaeensis TaxID=1414722 RepID=UPI0009AE2244|nr:amidohydrolase family protein [Candidatus Protochlamydia phocaeensis]
MRKIALEEHFITPDFIAYSKENFAGFNQEEQNSIIGVLSDFEDLRLKAMDNAGISISVLSLTDPGVQREPDAALAVRLARKANDALAGQIQKHPTRFRGFAHLALQDPPAAAAELERCVRDLHFVGALINGQTNGHYLDEEPYYPFWERVQELDVPIYLHPGNAFQMPYSFKNHPELNGAIWGWAMETGTHALRLVFSGFFDRFPSIRLILGHMGEALPYFLWRFDSRWGIMKHSIELKKPPSQYIKDHIAITISGMYANEPLLCALNALGEDSLMFSTDYPYESSQAAAQFIEQAPLKEDVRQKICYKNAERFLNLNL